MNRHDASYRVLRLDRARPWAFAGLTMTGLWLAPSVGSAVLTNSPTTAPAVLSDAVFAPTSFWYRPIPNNAPLHAKSSAFVAEFIRQKKAFYGTVSINLTAYASPVYVVPRDQPTLRVAQWACFPQFGLDRSLAVQWSAVPLPSYAIPAAGSDSELTVYQP